MKRGFDQVVGSKDGAPAETPQKFPSQVSKGEASSEKLSQAKPKTAGKVEGPDVKKDDKGSQPGKGLGNIPDDLPLSALVDWPDVPSSQPSSSQGDAPATSTSVGLPNGDGKILWSGFSVDASGHVVWTDEDSQ